jgi:citronellyl-CoA dehydrogenase
MSALIATPEHQVLRDTVSRFVAAEINPQIDAWEAAGAFPAHALFKKLGNLGLLGITKPAEYGGSALDHSFALVFAEELGRSHCAGVPMAIGVQVDMCTPALARFGSDELKREFLAPAIAGDTVGCIGVSEPAAGSDVAGLKTFARKDGGDYVISGSKMWITNGLQADWICLLANTGEGNPHRNKSLIMVPLDRPGVQRAGPLDKLGNRCSDTAQLFFDEVRVPQRYRIGAEGEGFALQMQQFQAERIYAAAGALKGMESVIQETVAYAAQRQAFGAAILDNQVVHFRLAELQTEVEALRALTYRATELYVANPDDPAALKLASMAKLKTGRLAREIGDACLQYWGGMGYMWDNRVARYWRDARLLSIGGGADEVMLGIICKLMGTLPGKPRAA